MLRFLYIKFTGCCWMILASFILNAATVDTVSVKSLAMNKSTQCVVIKPNGYDENPTDRYVTVYVLHGYSGNYSDWVKKAPNVKALADQYDILVICPDGAKSWYFDSPVDNNMRYETHIIQEVIPFIDKNYRTLNTRDSRAITGLSMGGHGALFLALNYPELFAAAGSMSGGVDLTPFPGNWEIADRLGKYDDQPAVWEQHSVINRMHLASGKPMAFMIDCGVDDFFLQVNRALHERMLYLNIPHHYIERPGAHNWEYWQEAVAYQVLFFHRVFSKK